MGIGPISMYSASPAYAPPDAYGQTGASVYGQTGASYGASYGASTAGSPGQISKEQVVLQQQMKPAVCAALDTLQRVQPLSQTIDFGELAALRAAIAAALNALLEEANRADGPRRPRTDHYLIQLVNDGDDNLLDAFREIVLEEEDSSFPFDSTEEESRRAMVELLSQQIGIVKTLWDAFHASVDDGSYSQGVILVQRLLGSTAGATRAWVEEMDAFGFTFEERRLAQIGDKSGALKRALQIDAIVDHIDAVRDYLDDLKTLVTSHTRPRQAT
jgi:hypothetical protein